MQGGARGVLAEPERCLGESGAPSSEEPGPCPAVEPLLSAADSSAPARLCALP